MVLESPRQQRFAHLSVHRLLRGQQRVLHQLLGDRGTALAHLARLHVGGQRAEGAAHVDTVVFPEPVVFHTHDRVDDGFGHLAQLHWCAVLVSVQNGQGGSVAPLHDGSFAQFGHTAQTGAFGRRPATGEGPRLRNEDDETDGEKRAGDYRRLDAPKERLHSALRLIQRRCRPFRGFRRDLDTKL